MGWDESTRIAAPIVEAIQKFDESSSQLSKEMIKLSRRIYWLTWVIVLLTIAVVFITVWSGSSSKSITKNETSVSTRIESNTPQMNNLK
jgi:hypothetical protein